MPDDDSRDAQKRRAADAALEVVTSYSVVGLGSGSTAAFFIEALGTKLRNGSLVNVRGVPTSRASGALAREHGVPLVTPEDVDGCDVVVDGADEVDPSLNLVKGLGGALLREKVVAVASKRRVIVVDAAKRVERLGTKSPLPVEVVAWSHTWAARAIEAVGGRPTIRGGRDPYITDNGNLIYDVTFDGGIEDTHALQVALLAIPGVVETGLFLGIADTVIVATDEGVETLTRQ